VVNAAAKRKFRLASPHSKVQLDEDGSNEIEVSLEPSTVAPRSNSCSDSSVSSAPAALVVQGMFIQQGTVHECGHLRPRHLLGGTEECRSGALLALVGGGGLLEGGQRQR